MIRGGLRYASIPVARIPVARLSDRGVSAVRLYEPLLDIESEAVTDAADEVVTVRRG